MPMDFFPRLMLPVLAEAEGLHYGWNIFLFNGLAVVVVLFFATLARLGLKGRVFTSLPTRLAEHLFLFIEGMAVSVIGPHGKKYVPLLLSQWTLIFTSNVMILLLPHAPTADWSLNLGLALATIAYVQWEGIRANGLIGHIRHFAGPKLGLAMIGINVMLFCVEIISELMKNFSLSIRLFGNIYGGHVAVDALNSMIPINGGVPLGGLILPIKFFTCVIQAFVFTILTCTYLSIVTSHEDDAEHYDVESMHLDTQDGHLKPDRPQGPTAAHV